MVLLLTFIFGIIFTQYIIPLIDGLTSWFLTYIELKKARLAEQTQSLLQPPTETQAIGFAIPTEEVVEEEEDDL